VDALDRALGALNRLGHALQQRVLLAALPFALLANTSGVLLSTRIEPDGSALRQIGVVSAPYFRSQLPRWVDDVRVGARWDGAWAESHENEVTYARDARLAGLGSLGEEASLTISDVFQSPLSLYTTYHWREVVTYGYVYAGDAAAAKAMDKKLHYEVELPGVVTSASVSPSQGSSAKSDGNLATFELDASQGQQTVEAESSSLRWGYLLVIAYVVGFVAYRVARVIAYQVHIRPRKI
jgi:hypothetical protein